MKDYNLQIIINTILKNSGIISFNKNINEATKTTLSFSEKMAKVSAEFTAISSVAGTLKDKLGGLLGGAINEFQDFEKQMSKVKAITGASEEEFKKLNDIAKQMGATTAYTAKEAGDALEFLGMAGLSVKESMDALPGALQLASAGNLSLGESADIATNIMAQFGIEAKNIGRVNDVLAKSATSANTSVQEMAEAMKYLGPIANSFNIPLEESAAVVNILANNGIKAGMATQSFSSSLLRLTKPSDKALGLMEELNFTAFDTNGNFKGLEGVVKDLEKSLNGLTQEQKASFIATVFGAESTKQWMTLLKEGSGEIARYTDSLNNASGTAEKMAEVQLDNLAGSFTLLKSAISGLMIDIGEALSSYLRPAVDGLTSFLTNLKDGWNSLPGPVQKFLKIVGGLAIVLGGLLVVFTSVAAILPLLGTAFAVLTGPIGIVTGVITAFVLAYQNNFLGLKDITDSVLGKIGEFFNYIGEGFGYLADTIFEYFERIKGPFLEFVDFILPFIEGFFNTFSEFFSNSFDNIILFLEGAWNVIQGIFQVAFGIIGGLLEVFINLFTGNWEGLGIALGKIVINIVEGIGNILQGGFKMFWAITSQAFDLITGIFNTFWEGAKTIFSVSLKFLENLISGVINGIVSIVLGILKIFGIDLFGIWEDIKNTASQAWEGLKTLLSDIWNGISESATSIFTGIADSITGIFQGAIDFVKNAWESIKGIWEWVTGASNDINAKSASASTKALAQGYKGGVTGGRAYGGNVGAGKGYIVGERGPEMFIPAQNGTIIPNNQLGGNTININMGGVVVKTEADEIRLIEKMKTELTRTLQLNKRGIL